MGAVLKAAFGKVDITPEERTPLQGYNPDENIADPDKDILDPLYARILLLESDACRFVIVGVDSCMTHEELVKVPDPKGAPGRYREFAAAFPRGTAGAWARAAGTNERFITVNATHTHSAPVHFSPKYTERVERKISELTERLVPVKLEIGYGECSISVNRRPGLRPNYDIPIDKTLQVVLFKDLDSRPLGSIVACAVHPTMLKNPRNRVSSETVGLAAVELEEHYGGSFVALFLQGFSADVCPIYKGQFMGQSDVDTYPTVRLAGHQLFLDMMEALNRRKDAPVYPMTAARSSVFLPTRRDAYEADLPVELMALRIGDMVVLSVSGEIFNGYVGKILKRSPFQHTLFSGLANGYTGYLPTVEAWRDGLGGYEMNTTPFVEQADPVFVEAAVKLLHELA